MKQVAIWAVPAVFAALAAFPALAAEVEAGAAHQRVFQAGSRPSAAVGNEHFTGTARLDPLFSAEAPARSYAAVVTFEPGARTHWHTHPLGQRLIVTSGMGLTQEWGGKVTVLRPGDVVVCPPGVKHWHGASPTTAMSHIAVGEALDGKSVEWMEKVTDEQYMAR